MTLETAGVGQRRRRRRCCAAGRSSRGPALRVPGARRRGAEDPRGGPRGDRPARVVTEVMESTSCRTSSRARRRAPDRRPQHAELQLLLPRSARRDKPVLLKRGMSATLEEFLLAAEYIMAEGNPQVMLCERGIRTFERSTRFTLDISAVPVLQEETHLPVIVDPSIPPAGASSRRRCRARVAAAPTASSSRRTRRPRRRSRRTPAHPHLALPGVRRRDHAAGGRDGQAGRLGRFARTAAADPRPVDAGRGRPGVRLDPAPSSAPGFPPYPGSSCTRSPACPRRARAS